jgi:hypothetical protein
MVDLRICSILDTPPRLGVMEICSGGGMPFYSEEVIPYILYPDLQHPVSQDLGQDFGYFNLKILGMFDYESSGLWFGR